MHRRLFFRSLFGVAAVTAVPTPEPELPRMSVCEAGDRLTVNGINQIAERIREQILRDIAANKSGSYERARRMLGLKS